MTLMATLAISGTALAGKDDAAVMKVHDDLAASWNKNDYKAMAALFADDASLINPLGRIAKGRAQIEKLYADEQTGPFKGSHFSSDCTSGVQFAKPDVAIVTCTFEVKVASCPMAARCPRSRASTPRRWSRRRIAGRSSRGAR
jgi:uncharacterized protein (TIGR02246 family)